LLNLDPSPPSGRLELYAVNLVCEEERILANIPLDALQLSGDWSTRCFDLALGPQENLGLAVVGAQYHLGIDAVRLGPPCQ
jgi:hypothetical protein